MVGEREQQRRQQRRFRREAEGERRVAGRVTGSRKVSEKLRAVRRTADVFLGRMDNEVIAEDIEHYIKECFGLNVDKIEELKIMTNQYKAFKVTLPINEREKLFNAELWPEDVIVDKYYNRSKSNL